MKTIFDLHQKVEYKIEYKKGGYIIEEGQTSHEYLVMQSGLMRSFVYAYNGDDVSTDFFAENEIVIEVSSLFQGTPTKEYIQTITDCSCYKVDFDSFQELFHFKRRSISIIRGSATDRYLTPLKECPQIIPQAPLKHIASYLEVTGTSLSRIRKMIKL